MKRIVIISFYVLVAILFSACSETSHTSRQGENSGTEVKDFAFGAATQGGFWYVFAGAIGDEMQKTIPGSTVAIVEGGSISNIKGIENGQFHIAFSNGEAIPEALEGIGQFESKAENIRWMATFYPNPLHIVVRADSDIYSIEDLKGKRVSPGIKGYSGELMFQRVLELNDMSYDDLEAIDYVGTSDSINLIRDGHLDAFVGVLATPSSTIQELDSSIGVRLISLSKDVVEQMKEANEGFVPHTIEAGTYSNFEEDTLTVAPFTTLLANKDLDDETVYTLTKLIVENADKWKKLNVSLKSFDGQYSVDNRIGPIHPGAEKYYKEAGYLTE